MPQEFEAGDLRVAVFHVHHLSVVRAHDPSAGVRLEHDAEAGVLPAPAGRVALPPRGPVRDLAVLRTTHGVAVVDLRRIRAPRC